MSNSPVTAPLELAKEANSETDMTQTTTIRDKTVWAQKKSPACYFSLYPKGTLPNETYETTSGEPQIKDRSTTKTKGTQIKCQMVPM